MNDLGTILKV